MEMDKVGIIMEMRESNRVLTVLTNAYRFDYAGFCM